MEYICVCSKNKQAEIRNVCGIIYKCIRLTPDANFLAQKQILPTPRVVHGYFGLGAVWGWVGKEGHSFLEGAGRVNRALPLHKHEYN